MVHEMSDLLHIRPGEQLLRRAEVLRRTGWSGSTLDRRVRDGICPQPIAIGGRSVAWVGSEIDELIMRMIRADRDTPRAARRPRRKRVAV